MLLPNHMICIQIIYILIQINQLMLRQTQPKQNLNSNHSNQSVNQLEHYPESIMQQLTVNQNILNELRKQVRQKVNKNDFISGMSSKVSISDITNLSNNFQANDDSYLHKNHLYVNQMKEQLKDYQKRNSEQIQVNMHNMSQKLLDRIQVLQQKIDSNKLIWQKEKLQLLLLIQEDNQQLSNQLQSKTERSEFQKVMHLSSLLAIQFQLIKKRFGNFEVDYNSIWKQISNIYSNQQSIKQTIDQFEKQKRSYTQLQEQKSIKNNRIEALFNHKYQNLFNHQHIKAGQSECETQRDINLEIKIDKIFQEIHHSSKTDQHNTMEIKLFQKRLDQIQQQSSDLKQSYSQLSKIKKEMADSISLINRAYEYLNNQRQQYVHFIKQQSQKAVNSIHQQIKNQISEACEEISTQMVRIFNDCTRKTDIQNLKSHFYQKIEEIDADLSLMGEKLLTSNSQTNKYVDNVNSKVETLESKIKTLKTEISQKVNSIDLIQQLQKLSTSQQMVKNIKLSENRVISELSHFKKQQQLLNNIIESQNILARWVWSSGELKGGNLIIWQKQIINTLPQNFIHSNHDYCIKIVREGIYKIQMGFYSKKRPTVQIIVNGKSLISAINNSSYVVHHSSGKLKGIQNTEIAGLTHIDYFTLPENSRIAISYVAQFPGHGFFGIQRL